MENRQSSRPNADVGGVGQTTVRILFTPIRYVFYRLLMYKLRDPQENMPVLVACLVTTLLLLINGMSAWMIVNFGRQPLLPPVDRLTFYAIGMPVELLAYLLMRAAWVDNGNLDRLSAEFQPQGRVSEQLRAVLFWSYLCLTVALPIGLAIMHPHTSSATPIRP